MWQSVTSLPSVSTAGKQLARIERIEDEVISLGVNEEDLPLTEGKISLTSVKWAISLPGFDEKEGYISGDSVVPKAKVLRACVSGYQVFCVALL